MRPNLTLLFFLKETKLQEDAMLDLISLIRSSQYHTETAIGLSYMVPCLRNPITGEFWPVIPLVHDDREIGADFLHVHYDFRFFYDFELKEFNKNCIYGKERHRYVVALNNENSTLFIIENRLCVREPGIPQDNFCSTGYEVFKSILEDNDKNKEILDCGRCPHKGHKFSSQSIKGTGSHAVLHCPLHGMKFKMRNGKLLKCQQDLKRKIEKT